MPHYLHAEVIAGRVLHCFNVAFDKLNSMLCRFYFIRQAFHVVLCIAYLVGKLSRRVGKFGYFTFQRQTLLNEWVPCCRVFYVGVGQRYHVGIFYHSNARIFAHCLRDNGRLVFELFPHIRVKAVFNDVVENFDFVIHIALTENTAVTLFEVARTPWSVEIM